jgi:hypothetical protein
LRMIWFSRPLDTTVDAQLNGAVEVTTQWLAVRAFETRRSHGGQVNSQPRR